MPSNRLIVLATCTAGKSRPTLDRLKLQGIPHGSIEARAAAWGERLAEPASVAAALPAVDLYQGAYWSNVKALVASAAAVGFEPNLFVASAGYGLVAAEDRIASYSATFGGGHPDAVSRGVTERGERRALHAAWWRALGRRKGARRLGELSEVVGEGSVLVLGSAAYLGAIEQELVELKVAMRRPAGLVVCATRGASREARLRESMVEYDAGLRAKVGGPLTVLHPRVARRIVEAARGGVLDSEQARRVVISLGS